MSRRNTALVLGLVLLLAVIPAGRRLGLDWVYARIQPGSTAALTVPDGLPDVRARTCGACHALQYREWASSKMGLARVGRVFAADFEAQGEPFVCLRCHSPLLEQQPVLVDGLASLRPLVGRGPTNPSFDAELQAEGVTCVACHLQDGVLVGPIADPQGAPHPTRYDPDFSSSDLCARCHQLDAPPLSGLERPMPDTHGEHARWQALTGSTESCVSCHMPISRRPAASGGPVRQVRSHRFVGLGDPGLMRRAVALEDVRRVEGAVELTLVNLAGHGVPTAEPARALVVKVIDGGGELAGEVELARRVPLPRYQELGDDTLQPGERRALRIPVTSEAYEVVVELHPLRFPPPGLDEKIVRDHGRPVFMARALVPWPGVK